MVERQLWLFLLRRLLRTRRNWRALWSKKTIAVTAGADAWTNSGSILTGHASRRYDSL